MGLITAILALLALCAGLLPVPFTLFICYPSGIVLGIISLVLGFQAQRVIRQRNESGRRLARLAAWIGGLTIILTVCLITAGTAAYPYISEFMRQALK